jgi:hypothetical protein
MDRHNRCDPVGLSVVLASFTVVVGACLFLLQRDPDWQGRAFGLRAFELLVWVSILSTAVYAVGYPIYRGVRWTTTRGASEPHLVAVILWCLTLGALFMLIAIPMYAMPHGRSRLG